MSQALQSDVTLLLAILILQNINDLVCTLLVVSLQQERCLARKVAHVFNILSVALSYILTIEFGGLSTVDFEAALNMYGEHWRNTVYTFYEFIVRINWQCKWRIDDLPEGKADTLL